VFVKRNVALILTICAVIVFFQPIGKPQSTAASVTGRVLDPSNAAIPNATITVLNVDTQIAHHAVSNDDGLFSVSGLLPGNYRIEVAKPGFKTVIKPDVVLHVQDVVAINFRMILGSVTESVTVEGGAPLINTESSAVSTVVDRQFAENLPMNGRSFQTLINLTPGVVVTSSSAYDTGQFSVNGQRAASNYWMVDGVSANTGVGAPGISAGNGFGGTVGSFSALGGTNSLVSVDALQEFRIQTSTFAPEFGRTPGAQISIITRSGTDVFHGTAFDYLRNDILDANNWFANQKGLTKPRERQNDFGGTISGPFVKDRTFFFFSYEGLRLRLPVTSLTTVPDLFARQNAVLAMQPYLNAFPLPTPGAVDNTTTGIAQFNASYSNPATLDAYSLRVDHKLSSKCTLFGRYNYSPSEFVNRGSSGTAALSVVQPFRITAQSATAGTTWTVSPQIVTDFRLNYSRTNAEGNYSLDGFGGAIPLTNLPFPSPHTSDDSALVFIIRNLSGGGLKLGRFGHNVQRQINLVNSSSWQRGKHSLKFGVDFRRLSPKADPQAYEQEPLFRSVQTAETGSAFFGIVFSNAHVTLLFRNLSAYAQDTWRVLPRFTLTYGLRWDLDFAPSSLNGPSIPAVTGYSLTDFSRLAVAPAGTSPFKTAYGNVAPRLGVAYQISQNPAWQTVVRGGLGVFYDLASAETGNLLSLSVPPFSALKFFSNQSFPYTSAQSAPPSISTTGNLSNLIAFNPNLTLPYTVEWNAAFEQSLGRDQSISVTYVGAAGRRLLQTTVISFPSTNPNLNGSLVDNTAASDYNALQVSFQRRLSHGLQALGSYTWAHSLDDASASSFGNPSNKSVPGSGNANRGSSDFDIRNAFTAGLTYDIPVPRRLSRLYNSIFPAWSVETFVTARSGPPVDLSDVNFFQLNGGIQANIRPDVVPGQPYYLLGSQYPGQKAFNAAAFTDPPVDASTGNPLRQGNLGRNALRGFGATQWDFSVHRNLSIRETFKLQFRTDIFNVLNHPNFGSPNNRFGGAGFGLSLQTLGQSLVGSGGQGAGAFNPLYQIGGPRSVQVALKLIF
jgi:hypothetical protein